MNADRIKQLANSQKMEEKKEMPKQEEKKKIMISLNETCPIQSLEQMEKVQ